MKDNLKTMKDKMHKTDRVPVPSSRHQMLKEPQNYAPDTSQKNLIV